MKQRIYLRLQTYSKQSLNVLIKKLKELSSFNNFSFSSICLPMRKKVYTVLKSPHVNKTAKEQFEIRFYNHLFLINGPFFNDLFMRQIKQCIDSKILLKISA
jgi:small subunit ribosomal protein S10